MKEESSMPRIILGAGHEGRTSGATGAPGEQSFNIDICNKVADELKIRGFEVRRINADPLPEEISGDWDLALFCHYDADIYGTGGFFVDTPLNDGAAEKSQKIAYLLRQEYGGTTGIVYHPERRNVNTWDYYMWKRLSWNTPCVLIECGVGMHVPDDHTILHFQREKVVEGIVKGICASFGVPYDLTTTSPLSTPITVPDACSEVKDTLQKIHDIIWGKGWVWVRMNKLKELLPK